jgi:N-acetylmuramic acid 6-phosphate etherase
MSVLRATEQRDASVLGIDSWDDARVLAALLAGQTRALACVEAATPALAEVASLAVDRLRDGGRMIYLAAGSPALIALGDALEIPQTYGEPAERFATILAGGLAITESLVGGPEDDAGQARRDIAAASVGPQDCVVAISASGSTPYTVAGLEAAREAGAATAAVVNNPGTPLANAADVAVVLDSGPEIVAGSTRMGAGTAQKVALNMLSTLIAIRLGHVHDGHMIGLRADNAKLHHRAARMVEDIAGVGEEAARDAVAKAGGDVKLAVLIAAGLPDAEAARQFLLRHAGHLRAALDDL